MLPDFATALHLRLTTDTALTDVVPAERIQNFIQDDAPYPHIDWRLEDVEHGDSKDEENYEGSLVLEVFTDYSGDLKSYEIHQLIYTLLHAQPLSVTGANNPIIRFESINVTTADDNRERQATITYSFMIGEP